MKARMIRWLGRAAALSALGLAIQAGAESRCETIFKSGILVRLPNADLERFALVNRSLWEGLNYDTRLNVAEAIRECTKVPVREIKDGRSGKVLATRSSLGGWSLK